MNRCWGIVCWFPIQPCKCVSKAPIELGNLMRRLWSEHVAWTRATVSGLVFNTPDASLVVARLLQNTQDMGDAIRLYYGETAAQKYSQLLMEHITLAGDLVKATAEGNAGKAADIERNWFQNGDQIAVFWSSVNPYLPLKEFIKMFYEHLSFIKQGMDSMFSKDFKAGVEVFDKMETEALEMSDMITNAIVKQFPYMVI